MNVSNFSVIPHSVDKVLKWLKNDKAILRLFETELYTHKEEIVFLEDKKLLKCEVKIGGVVLNISLTFEAYEENRTLAISEAVVARGKAGFCPKEIKQILAFFNFQQTTLAHDLFHGLRFYSERLKILISGSHGLIGKELKSFLEAAGHQVVSLVRDKKEKNEITWDPYNKIADYADFEGFDAFIHLAAEPIGEGVWSKRKKHKIYHSRIDSTFFLSQIVTKLEKPPKAILCASAVGIYGDKGSQLLDEYSNFGTGFLAKVCKDWEDAFLQKDKTRFINARFGAVLSQKGGLLRKILPMFKARVGAVLGNGEQYMSWVSINDAVYALYHLIMDPRAQGAYNICSPEPITNSAFTKILAKKLQRTAFLKIPAAVLKFLLKDKAEVILFSQRAVPSRIQEIGFSFFYSDLEKAFDHLII